MEDFPIAKRAIEIYDLGEDVGWNIPRAMFCADCGLVDGPHDESLPHSPAMRRYVGNTRYFIRFNNIDHEVRPQELDILANYICKKTELTTRMEDGKYYDIKENN